MKLRLPEMAAATGFDLYDEPGSGFIFYAECREVC